MIVDSILFVDDDYLFAYPYLFVTGHVGFRFSQEQKWRLKEYLERGGFLHIEDCDVRLNGGRGFMREAIHLLVKELFPEKKYVFFHRDKGVKAATMAMTGLKKEFYFS